MFGLSRSWIYNGVIVFGRFLYTILWQIKEKRITWLITAIFLSPQDKQLRNASKTSA